MNATRWRRGLAVLLGLASLSMVPWSGQTLAQANIPAPATALKIGTADSYPTQQVQYILKGISYSIVVDGDYGSQTKRVVQLWQKANGLPTTGVVDAKTWASLMAVAPDAPPAARAKRARSSRATTAPVVSVDAPAAADAPATPVQPRTDSQYAPEGLSGCDEMNWYRVNAGLPEVFDHLGFRESRCDNSVGNACCHGWWANFLTSHLSSQSAYRDRIINECGVTRASDIRGLSPQQKWAQACVTFVVYSISGLSPWAL